MSDLSISSATASTQTQQSQWAQRKSLFDQLGQALQNGDLKGAQTAFAALQANAPQGAQAQGAQNGSSQSPFAALATALQNGDLSGAQQAFSQIQQTQGHHHHHHHGSQASSSTAAPTSSNTNAPTVNISGSNDTVNIYETGNSGTGSVNLTA